MQRMVPSPLLALDDILGLAVVPEGGLGGIGDKAPRPRLFFGFFVVEVMGESSKVVSGIDSFVLFLLAEPTRCRLGGPC